jgi:hypothetical protein
MRFTDVENIIGSQVACGSGWSDLMWTSIYFFYPLAYPEWSDNWEAAGFNFKMVTVQDIRLDFEKSNNYKLRDRIYEDTR